MAQKLRRFFPRAPRYILRPNDQQLLRFASRKESNRSYSTQFVNMSETGLAFLIDRDCVPHLGDIIKVEFPVPGGSQIAWWARVVRIEEYKGARWWSKDKNFTGYENVLVGIQFLELPEGHRQMIREGLEQKYAEIRMLRRKRHALALLEYTKDNYKSLLMFFVLALVTVGILYLLSRPTENYDERRGAPWGQRFNSSQDSTK